MGNMKDIPVQKKKKTRLGWLISAKHITKPKIRQSQIVSMKPKTPQQILKSRTERSSHDHWRLDIAYLEEAYHTRKKGSTFLICYLVNE